MQENIKKMTLELISFLEQEDCIRLLSQIKKSVTLSRYNCPISDVEMERIELSKI